MKICIKLITALILIELLQGCTVVSGGPVIPNEGPTTEEIYRMKMSKSYEGNLDSIRLQVNSSSSQYDNVEYTRTAKNELDSLFQRLSNPDIVMYVFPHLAGPNNAPIPGYSTTFSFYESPHYALPGEQRG